MTHELSITVDADVDLHELRLLVAGCLTTGNQPGLLPVIRRACALEPLTRVTVDLTEALHIDPTALVLLRTAVDQIERDEAIEPVVFLVPEHLPACPAVVEAEMQSER